MVVVSSGQMTISDLNDSKQLVMYIGASQSRTVIYNGVSTYTPLYSSTNQVLTPQLFIAGDNTDVASGASARRWFYQSNGTGVPVAITANTPDFTLGTNNATLTIVSNIMASRTSMTIICEMDYLDTGTGFTVTSKAEIEIVRVTNGTNGTSGTNAIIGVLSNESHTIPTDSAGNNGNFTGATTTMSIYEGASLGTGWTFAQTKVNVTVTEATTSATATVTAMSADTGYIEFVASKNGYASITKRFNLSKSKAGTAGTSPTAYTLISSADALQKSITNVFTPATVTFTAKSQTGSGAIANYLARWVIEDTVDNTTWTSRYSGTVNENSRTYTPSSTSIKAVRVKMYLAGGQTTLLDEQTLPVVVDGSTGENAVYAYVWTPDGNAIKNSTGSLNVRVDIYSGSTKVTGTAWKWYIQDPTATTASGGDTDGGAGWRLLNATYNAGTTGYATDTLVVPASAITGQESFKCVATYSSTKYTGVTTVVDLSDPIVVRIDGVSTFKNGQGSTTLKATVLQSGAEIDSAGTTYTYTWSIYDSTNVKTAFAKTGKSITVDATDVDGRGNVVCEISK